jgi:DNA modification methylase
MFAEVRRVLRDDGTLWLNIGDSYAGSWSGHSMRPEGGTQRAGKPGFQPLALGYPAREPNVAGCKPKDLVGIPWMLAFALRADGWYLRSDIIWSKPNPMPESVTDRPTKAHEYLFLLSKRDRYHYDAGAIQERAFYAGKVVTLGEKSLSRGQANGANIAASGNGTADSVVVADGRNKRSVWTIATEPYPEAHFATFPTALVKPCILAGCPEGGTVLDPFAGSGTTLQVAKELGRKSIGIELNPEYVKLIEKRMARITTPFAWGEVS